MRFSTELQVKLGNLSYNYDELKKITNGNETIFMVKADAYGHGVLEIVTYAYLELGIKRFGCASLGEAKFIREQLPNLFCELWVFSDTEIGVEQFKETYLDLNIIPVIHAFKDLEYFVRDKELSHLPLVIKLDTGMHRLGINQTDIAKMITLLKNSNRKSIHHLMTHFSNSYLKIKSSDRTSRQYEIFNNTKNEIRAAGLEIEETSCANSGAIEQGFGLSESHIRPGLMLYGPASTNNKNNWNGKTLSTFKTKVLKIEQVKRGTPIGYGSHVCAKNGFIAYLPVGYGDGILTFYSGTKFKYHGQQAQIIGRVNMDITAVFFENKIENFGAGSEFIFWDDSHYDISQLAMQMKTIPYQLFTALSARVPRRYIK